MPQNIIAENYMEINKSPYVFFCRKCFAQYNGKKRKTFFKNVFLFLLLKFIGNWEMFFKNQGKDWCFNTIYSGR